MSKTLENLTRDPWVGVGLAGLVVAVGLYFLLKKAGTDTLSFITDIPAKIGEATGLSQDAAAIADDSPDSTGATFASWYDPTARTVFFYYLTFPDGDHHFVGAGSVNSDATFDYDGTPYRIGNSKAGDLRAYAWGS